MSVRVDSIRLENDESAYTLVLDRDGDKWYFDVDPQDLLDAVEGYRQHLAGGESVRVERAGGVFWTAHIEDERELADEALRVGADLARKAVRENYRGGSSV